MCKLRGTVCYFDTFIYRNMIALVAILLSHYIIIVQYDCLYSLRCALTVYGLFTHCYKLLPLNTISLISWPHPLVTNILLSFYTLDFFRFHK